MVALTCQTQILTLTKVIQGYLGILVTRTPSPTKVIQGYLGILATLTPTTSIHSRPTTNHHSQSHDIRSDRTKSFQSLLVGRLTNMTRTEVEWELEGAGDIPHRNRNLDEEEVHRNRNLVVCLEEYAPTNLLEILEIFLVWLRSERKSQ